MNIDELPLDPNIINFLKLQGYTKLYPPQKDAVKAGVLDGESMLVSVPTASGKTLIAMLAALSHLPKNKSKVIYLTPLRALAAEKFEEFKKLDTKHNALGNLICVNDKGGVISPIIEKEYIKEIEDILDIEVIQKRVAGYHQVGAVMEANNLGGVIHPEADEEDIKNFSNILGVNIEPATINGGIPFVSSGMLANSNAVVVGTLTNGPEIMMLTRAFTN